MTSLPLLNALPGFKSSPAVVTYGLMLATLAPLALIPNLTGAVPALTATAISCFPAVSMYEEVSSVLFSALSPAPVRRRAPHRGG